MFFLNQDRQYVKRAFYRQLKEEAPKQNVKSLAVFPHSIEEGKAYLESIQLVSEIECFARKARV